MTNNIDTKNIQVFPSARRVKFQRTARLFTEKNLTSIVNQLLNVYGFVITKPSNAQTSSTSEPFEFNIAGYYFRVEQLKNILDAVEATNASAGDIIYATITLNTVEDVSSETGTFIELDGQDEPENVGDTNTKYSGVSFTLLTPSTDNLPDINPVDENGKITYNLILLICTGSNTWKIYPGSTIKFDQSSIRRINCGTITPETKNSDWIPDSIEISADYSYITDWGDENSSPLYISEDAPETSSSVYAWIDLDENDTNN